MLRGQIDGSFTERADWHRSIRCIGGGYPKCGSGGRAGGLHRRRWDRTGHHRHSTNVRGASRLQGIRSVEDSSDLCGGEDLGSVACKALLVGIQVLECCPAVRQLYLNFDELVRQRRVGRPVLEGEAHVNGLVGLY